MEIENNILGISKVMFSNNKNWKYVTDVQKEQFFFIFNRYFSRKYPELAQLLNQKDINKSQGLDLWASFVKDKPYPQWFWPKVKKSPKSEDNQPYLFDIMKTHNLKECELDFLIKNYPEEIDEEIKYLKQIKNGNNR